MRSHIQVLMGYAELLQDDAHLDLDDRAASYLSAMRRVVDQIGRAVDNLVADYVDVRRPLPLLPAEEGMAQVSGGGWLGGPPRLSATGPIPVEDGDAASPLTGGAETIDSNRLPPGIDGGRRPSPSRRSSGQAG
jgi:hypothetical protein